RGKVCSLLYTAALGRHSTTKCGFRRPPVETPPRGHPLLDKTLLNQVSLLHHGIVLNAFQRNFCSRRWFQSSGCGADWLTLLRMGVRPTGRPERSDIGITAPTLTQIIFNLH